MNEDGIAQLLIGHGASTANINFAELYSNYNKDVQGADPMNEAEEEDRDDDGRAFGKRRAVHDTYAQQSASAKRVHVEKPIYIEPKFVNSYYNFQADAYALDHKSDDFYGERNGGYEQPQREQNNQAFMCEKCTFINEADIHGAVGVLCAACGEPRN